MILKSKCFYMINFKKSYSYIHLFKIKKNDKWNRLEFSTSLRNDDIFFVIEALEKSKHYKIIFGEEIFYIIKNHLIGRSDIKFIEL